MSEHLQKHPQDTRTPTQCMRRLRLLVPFYSIEAWLYQNTREARRLCVETGCKQCHEKLAGWERNRASLDEETTPKKKLCFQDKHNAHLASSGFPTQEVFDAEVSFQHAVMNLLECEELMGALERTYATPEPQSH